MANVYISYSGADAYWAHEIHRWLGEDGHNAFLATQGEVQAGDEWETRLYERLGWADALVPVVTPSYLGSVWCAAEVGAARGLKLEILPVRASGDVPTAELLGNESYVDVLLGNESYVDVVRDPSDARERLRARLNVIDEQRAQQAGKDAVRRRMSQRFDEKPNGVFVCYRREDSRWQAGRLADALANRFGESAVFIDVDRVRIGNWRKQIDESLAECAAVIVVIGPLWHAELDSREAIKDLVRYEITQALRLGKTIIPVTVDRVRLPDHGDLPDDIAAIADAQGYELGVDVMWRPTVGKLLDDLSALLQDNSAAH